MATINKDQLQKIIYLKIDELDFVHYNKQTDELIVNYNRSNLDITQDQCQSFILKDATKKIQHLFDEEIIKSE